GVCVILNNSGTFTNSETCGISFFVGTALTKTYTLSLHDALPIFNAAFATQSESGTFDVATGATIQFVSNHASVSEGDVGFSAGTDRKSTRLYSSHLVTTSIDMNVNVANFTMAGGTLNGPDTFIIT